MTPSKSAQLVTNHVVQHHVHVERDRFIESIAEDDVLRLASLHHDGELPTFFHPPGRNSHATMSATLCVSAPATSSASCASLCAFAALHGIQCAEQTRDGSGHDEVCHRFLRNRCSF